MYATHRANEALLVCTASLEFGWNISGMSGERGLNTESKATLRRWSLILMAVGLSNGSGWWDWGLHFPSLVI